MHMTSFSLNALEDHGGAEILHEVLSGAQTCKSVTTFLSSSEMELIRPSASYGHFKE